MKRTAIDKLLRNRMSSMYIYARDIEQIHVLTTDYYCMASALFLPSHEFIYSRRTRRYSV